MQGEALGLIDDAAIGLRGSEVAWVGPMSALPVGYTAKVIQHGGGALATPGLIDCHTHLVFAGHRAAEFEMRLHGASYEEIARAGGGIAATVAATRAASEEALWAASAPRLTALMAEGVTTVEIKSGYGLDTASELKMLRVAKRLGTRRGVTVRTTFLGAHALPVEFAGREQDYIDTVCTEMLPAVVRAGLADAVDAFCEGIGFSLAATERVLAAAHAHQLPVKLHAEQLSLIGGAALAARYAALSADHLEYLDDAGVEAMADAGTVAVLLPAPFYFLRETRLPPIAALRLHAVPIAIASDLNPGTSPVVSLRAAMHMACTLFRLTPTEVLRGVTVHAARALGLADRGTLAVGKRADFCLWDVDTPSELCYWLGGVRAPQVFQNGVEVRRDST